MPPTPGCGSIASGTRGGSPIPGDRIEVLGLRVLGHHGALEGEQELAQPFEIDLVVLADLGPASVSDDLGETLDYGALALASARIVESRRFRLLEALAAAIAESVLEDPRAEQVTVAVRKLRPPIPADLRSVGVEITRRRA